MLQLSNFVFFIFNPRGDDQSVYEKMAVAVWNGDNSMGNIKIYEWTIRFRAWQVGVDHTFSRRPLTVTCFKLRTGFIRVSGTNKEMLFMETNATRRRVIA
jgi:hypothetical protein